jgi:hypothetical protein
MNSDFIGFLNENTERRYPFVEGSSFLSIEEIAISNRFFLDFRVTHRINRGRVYLRTIVGSASGGSVTYPQVPGVTAIYFAINDGLEDFLLRFDLPDSAVEFPAVLESSVADPDYDGVLLANSRCVVGSDFLDFAHEDIAQFNSLAVEPSLCTSLFGNQIDHLQIIHADQDDEVIGGDLVMFGGYNLAVTQSPQQLRISPSPGAGSLGRYIGSSDSDSKCSGSVFSILGIAPNDDGNFFIFGDKGIEIENFPDANRVVIRIQPSKIGGVKC